MNQMTRLLEVLLDDLEAGFPAALCVVLGRRGSAPQVPGAAMLVRADGTMFGTIGGGAAEAEVTRRARDLFNNSDGLLLDLDLNQEFGTDDAAICGGRMTVGIVPVRRGVDVFAYRSAYENARDRRPARIPIRVSHAGRRLEYTLNIEVPPTLLIAGAGHVGQALARLAVDLDFRVVVIDDRRDMAARERFPEGVELIVGDIAGTLREQPIDAGSYVVIVTRGHEHDHAALDAVVRRPAGYVGVIGSRKKSAAILAALERAGVSRELIERVHTPIGVPIAALTVNEIAISIAAELIEVRRRGKAKVIEGPVELPTGEGEAPAEPRP